VGVKEGVLELEGVAELLAVPDFEGVREGVKEDVAVPDPV
jgi:hypothetical protein